MTSKIMAAAVAAACASLETANDEGAEAARKMVARRRLTVDIRVEGEAADDSALAPLVADALLEFVQSENNRASGMFESKAGLDVRWRACNEYFDRGGFRVHVDGDPGRHPVPMGMAYVNADASVLTIKGVKFSAGVFQTLANPDPAKRYSFARDGDVVVVQEVK